MQRLLSVRIVRWYFKLAYVVGAWALPIPVLRFLDFLGAPDLVYTILNLLTTVAAVLLGARIFRGPDEELEPPRAWWRMTARPRLSWVLGLFALLFFIGFMFALIAAALGVESALRTLRHQTIADNVSYGLLLATVTYLYLNSAIRLRHLPPRSVEPRFPSRVRLK